MPALLLTQGASRSYVIAVTHPLLIIRSEVINELNTARALRFDVVWTDPGAQPAALSSTSDSGCYRLSLTRAARGAENGCLPAWATNCESLHCEVVSYAVLYMLCKLCDAIHVV